LSSCFRLASLLVKVLLLLYRHCRGHCSFMVCILCFVLTLCNSFLCFYSAFLCLNPASISSLMQSTEYEWLTAVWFDCTRLPLPWFCYIWMYGNANWHAFIVEHLCWLWVWVTRLCDWNLEYQQGIHNT
jgi:hypothetical protein